MSFLARKFSPFYIGVFVFIADLISKYFTHIYLPLMYPKWLWYPYGGVGVFSNFFGIEFSLSHQINKGAAWGLLADYQVQLLYLRIVLIACLVVYAVFFNENRKKDIPLALIIAGAAGNVIDYFLYGHVIDMLHFVLWGYDFPIFNLADSAIFIGIFLFTVLTALESRPVKNKARRH